MFALTILSTLLVSSVAVHAVPNIYKFKYSSNNIVKVNSLTDMCLIAPLDPHTDIGVAEGSGTKTYCTDKARYDPPNQGRLPTDFFSDARYAQWGTVNKNQVRQITGCINTSHLSRLNVHDEGGQFDSSGQGNDGVPSQSFCILDNNGKRGYYVQQIEPAENRFCIRCCEDNNDCVHTLDTAGCEVAIPGYYGPSCK